MADAYRFGETFAIPKEASLNVRYPATLGTPPYEKWILFEVRSGRHIGRTGGNAADASKDRTLKSVALYLPPEALSSSLEVSWRDQESSLYGNIAARGLQSISDWLSSPPQKTETPGDAPPPTMSWGGAWDEIKKNVAAVTWKVGVESAERALGRDAAQLAKQTLGQMGAAINPRIDVFYEGIAYRTHSFSFTMIPRNIQEARSIDDILNTFQFYMLPRFGTTLENAVTNAVLGAAADTETFIGYPYEFNISTFAEHGKGVPHINKFDRCVLTGCNINHASGTRVSFINEQSSVEYFPTSTTLKLDFKEVRLQGRNQERNIIWRGGDPLQYFQYPEE